MHDSHNFRFLQIFNIVPPYTLYTYRLVVYCNLFKLTRSDVLSHFSMGYKGANKEFKKRIFYGP